MNIIALMNKGTVIRYVNSDNFGERPTVAHARHVKYPAEMLQAEACHAEPGGHLPRDNDRG